MKKYRDWKPKAEKPEVLPAVPLEIAVTAPAHEEVTAQFARTLRELRISKRMARGELAEEIGYSDISVLRWEHEKHPTYPEDLALHALKMYFKPHLDKFPYRGKQGIVRA